MSVLPDPAHPIIFYDGVCGLCNRFVRLILKHDRRDVFRFAPLQSGLARDVLSPHGIDPGDLDSVHLVLDRGRPGERVLSRSDAVLEVLRRLGGGWRFLATTLQVLPLALRNAAYHLVARTRYRTFGKFDTCPLPDVRDKHKFIDL